MKASKLKSFSHTVTQGLRSLQMNFFSGRKDKFGLLGEGSQVTPPVFGPVQNVYINEHCSINGHLKILGAKGNFIMKRNCSVGSGLTVITANHAYDTVGQFPESSNWNELIFHDVIVQEDVWIGGNVTLCPGVIIGRGSIVAAGSVCIKSKEYPPYSIVGGNPAKFIRFRLSLNDQIQQEKLRFIENERLPLSTLQNNWQKFSGKNL